MFNTLTEFIYRGLPCLAIAFGEGGSPHKFTPMPGVYHVVEADRVEVCYGGLGRLCAVMTHKAFGTIA